MKEREDGHEYGFAYEIFDLPLSSEKLSSERIREFAPNRYVDELLLPNIMVIISSNEIFDYQLSLSTISLLFSLFSLIFIIMRVLLPIIRSLLSIIECEKKHERERENSLRLVAQREREYHYEQ